LDEIMKKLYRSRRDSKLFGLCGGLADTLNVDATLLRLVVIITAVFSGGFPVIVLYVIASMVIPKEPGFDNGFATPHMGYGGHTHTSYTPPFTTPPAAGTAQQTPRQPVKDELDEMMKDVEQKALRKELEELRAKLAELERSRPAANEYHKETGHVEDKPQTPGNPANPTKGDE
jgi:phage shock protein C